jgi:gas vesicle structural protein
VTAARNRFVTGPSPSGLADVLELILDRGLVVDVHARVSLVGIEVLALDARMVVASVDTYLRFAEAVERMDRSSTQPTPVELASDAKYRVTKAATGGALDAVVEQVVDLFTPAE